MNYKPLKTGRNRQGYKGGGILSETKNAIDTLENENVANKEEETENFLNFIGTEKAKRLMLSEEYFYTTDERNDLYFTLEYAYNNSTLDNKVIDYITSLESSLAEKLVYMEFLPIAKHNKEKTSFEKLIKAELKNKRKQEKLLEQKELLSDMPSYAEKPLSREVIEEILGEFCIDVRLNIATNEIEITDRQNMLLSRNSKSNWLNSLPIRIYDICRQNNVKNMPSTPKNISVYLSDIADEHRYNPILDMLKSHYNTDSNNLEFIFETLDLTEDFYKTLVKKWLIQTVALAHNNEDTRHTAEGVLVLKGKQAKGKTSFFRTITGNQKWFTEGATIDMKDKDKLINSLSAWICELGELDNTLKKEQSDLKAFITMPTDKIRLPYAPAPIEKPRNTSFCGTVNEDKFLKDTTGNRRFWVIPIDNIDKHRLFSLSQEDVYNMWGYIESLYQENHNGYRLTDVELKRLNNNNLDYQSELKFEQEVLSLLDFSKPLDYWDYYAPVELSEYLRKCNICTCTAENVGRVLAKHTRENNQILRKRTNRGYKYFLPADKTMLSYIPATTVKRS